MNKRILTFVIATAMLLSSVACSGDTSTSSTSQSTATSGSTSTSSSTAPTGPEVSDNFNPTGLPILKEPDTFEIAFKSTGIYPASEKPPVIAAEEATNINIDWVEITTSAWAEKTNLMLSTGDLPDAILGGIDVNKNYELLMQLDPYLEAYAPNVMQLFEEREDYKAGLKQPDGHYYTLPTGAESIGNMIDSLFWINVEWMDKLGLEMPTTPEELETVLVAFKEQDPNGNGQADEIPLTFESLWGWANAMENLMGAFGVIENYQHVMVIDKQVIFSAADEGYYEGLKWLNGLHEQGLLDPQLFTLSTEQYNSRSAGQDILGMWAGYSDSSKIATWGDDKNNPRFEVLPVLEGEDGTKMISVNSTIRDSGFVISRDCEQPEALVRWYDYLQSSEKITQEWSQGAEDVLWEMTEVDGVERVITIYRTPDELKAALGEIGFETAADYRDYHGFSGQSPGLRRIDAPVLIDPDTVVSARTTAIERDMQYAVTGLPSGAGTPENEERRAVLITDIDNYLEKFVADSIINGIDDEKWAEHLETLNDLKVPEYTQLCQEYVDGVYA